MINVIAKHSSRVTILKESFIITMLPFAAVRGKIYN